MKVVVISTGLSEASAAMQLVHALREQGVEVTPLVCKDYMAMTYQESVEGYKASAVESLLWHGKRFIHKRVVKHRMKGYTRREHSSISTDAAWIPVHRHPAVMEADIIHLHWICNMISVKEMVKLCNLGKPVLWTCHDVWPFSGGCHKAYECRRYRENCGACQELLSDNSMDLTGKLMAKKKRYWHNLPVTMVGPSNWMVEELKSSALFGSNSCICLPNTYDENVFKPQDRMQLRALLNIPADGKLHVMVGGTMLTIPYKGYKYFFQMMELLRSQRPELLSKIVVHAVGTAPGDVPAIEGCENRFWGFVSDRQKLAQIYGAMDVMVFPSVDDNLPNMILESLACGTPVACFQTGGQGDLVEHKKNGYIAPFEDVQELLNGMCWILDHNDGNVLGKSGHEKMVREFGEDVIARRHIDTYERLLQEGKH